MFELANHITRFGYRFPTRLLADLCKQERTASTVKDVKFLEPAISILTASSVE